MAEETLIANTHAHLVAIELCLENRLHMPALVLIYCGIDIMAALGRPAGKAKVERSDFIHWAETYMDCHNRLKVSGVDLYGARCGVVHTYTMDSDLSAKGQARRLLYAWGTYSANEPTELMRHLGLPEVMLKIEDLRDAYMEGVATFAEAIVRDEGLSELVMSRTGKLFANRSEFP